ncbi:TrbC/VirB2 family protein [Paracidovorax citrulli]|uniref:TrbC/VirB2 family protein n=1 Tax=Paracidovorax citrulli TaxID=80869 RepID=UPI0006646072|nr:TrbC/VirB2 family protein [Paracidovorax citrulli]QCX13206.1 hypothetical protein APS58_p00062 [Paracidovorax citrulli]UMT93527.1 hypothetical protein FRC97_00030 [Paracidovorax citrulli]
MNASNTHRGMPAQDRSNGQEWLKALQWSVLLAAVALFLLPGLAHATGTGGVTQVQTRINNVGQAWQSIVMGAGVFVLTIAWAWIGYAIAFNGKTMKDLQNPALGSTIAGLAPILVGWMFS